MVYMREWEEERQTYLDEEIRREGLAGASLPISCAKCHSLSASLRCTDCVGARILCDGCLCSTHENEPLHRVKVRTSSAMMVASYLYFS